MKGFVRGVISPLSFIIFISAMAEAGGVENLVLSSTGQRIDVKAGEAVPEGARILRSKVSSTCAEAPGKACIKWKLALPAGMNPNDYLPAIITALNTMTNNASLNISFLYNGTTTYGGDLFQYTSPPTPDLDSYGNEIINPAIVGNFLISLLPPPEINFPTGVVSTTIKYIVPDLETNEGTIQWGGIFLNPDYQPGSDYRLDLVIAHEAMRMIGLAPSATRNALLFPAQSSQYQGALQLSKDDLASLQIIYPASGIASQKGSVSGEFIDGETGDKIGGGHIELIPISKVQLFAQTADRKLADVGAFSRETGVFKIQNVAPGDYVVIFESLKSIPLSYSLWDDWIFSFGSTLEFSTEFYDGAQREGNHESAAGFSPQLIYGAAIITVAAGQETSNVQLITNAVSADATTILAQGSTNEKLPEWGDISQRLLTLKDQQEAENDEAGKSGSGGCSLYLKTSDGGSTIAPIFLVLLTLFIGIFWRRSIFA